MLPPHHRHPFPGCLRTGSPVRLGRAPRAMRNVVLSSFPRHMRLPDPFTPNLKVDLLPEITQPPRILSKVCSRTGAHWLFSCCAALLRGLSDDAGGVRAGGAVCNAGFCATFCAYVRCE